MLHLTINQKNKNAFKIPPDIHQNGKSEKSDTTKLFYAREEAGTWGHIHMSCHPHSNLSPNSAVPSMPHRDLKEDTAATMPRKARVSQHFWDAKKKTQLGEHRALPLMGV